MREDRGDKMIRKQRLINRDCKMHAKSINFIKSASKVAQSNHPTHCYNSSTSIFIKTQARFEPSV